jgi:exonuclease 3'-5' domain-containing protein 1
MFYDCRNDVDALWNLHRVFPMNIWDLQLQELCYRRVRSKQTRLLNGLAKALTEHLGNMSADWKSHKYQGRKLFAPELGGSYKVSEARPLDPRVLAYSAADVELLFALRDALHRVQRAPWPSRIEAEGAKRALAAKGAAFAGKGRHMALAPTLW